MTWVLLFCAWGYKAGGCVSPTMYTSREACEFVLRHQQSVAGGVAMDGRCVGIRQPARK